MQSVQKSAQHKMLMRDPTKQPMIGRDRLTALRNANSTAVPHNHTHSHAPGHNHSHDRNHANLQMGSSASRTSSGKLPATNATASPSQSVNLRQPESV